jgi:hypothetical protein
MGWSLTEWRSLPPGERDMWLAYDIYLMNEYVSIANRLSDQKNLSSEAYTSLVKEFK